jgi:uncharacterized membrane protein (UPF0127 family)
MMLAVAAMLGPGVAIAHAFAWRHVSIAGRVRCLPVAYSVADQNRGLQGVRHVDRPLVFAFSRPTTVAFWMKDTPTPLTGVWVGIGHRVIGVWHGHPNSQALHFAPRPFIAALEYRAGARVPAVGTRITIGRSCPIQPGTL